jgi:hypothetical protein
LSAAVFLVVGARWLAILPDATISSVAFVWIFGMIILGSMSVVRHAEDLAKILGEPLGTLILTLSVSAIEIVTLGIVMTTGAPNPEIARDTMFSVVMLCLNGLIGASLILGALKYKEQDYNLRGGQRVPERHRVARRVRAGRAEFHVHDSGADVLRDRRKASWSPCASGCTRYSSRFRRRAIGRFSWSTAKRQTTMSWRHRPATGTACGSTSPSSSSISR